MVKTALCLFSVMFYTTKAIPSLQSHEVNFGSLIMFGVYQCLKLFKVKGKEAAIYWVLVATNLWWVFRYYSLVLNYRQTKY